MSVQELNASYKDVIIIVEENKDGFSSCYESVVAGNIVSSEDFGPFPTLAEALEYAQKARDAHEEEA